MKSTKVLMMRLTLLSCMVIVCFQIALGQIGNPSTMTDLEVRQLWNNLQESGISQTELQQYLTDNGLTLDQANSLSSRINALPDANDSEPEQTPNQEIQSQDVEEMDDEELKSQVFGYELFENSSANFQGDFNLPTPSDYVLGPGDQIIVQIYGTSQNNYNLKVNRDGKVSIPLIGPVSISGLTIAAAKASIKTSLSRIYSGLSSSNPSVFMELTLENVRSISVNIIGEVEVPGVYQISAFSNILNALYQSGGPNFLGSLRNISVIRGSKKIADFDLYDYLFGGKSEIATHLESNDIILVGTYETRVEILGAVKSPQIYEIKAGESIEEIINYAGSFTPSAFKESVAIKRLEGDDQKVIDVEIDEVFNILDGDAILVRESKDYIVEKLQIEGAVYRSGEFSWTEGITLQSLIDRAGGFGPDAITSGITIFQRRDDLTTRVISLDYADASSRELELKTGDLVLVPSQLEIKENQFIEIGGEVKEPTVLPFYEGMTVRDIVFLANGLTPAGVGGSIEVVRQIGNVTNGEQRYSSIIMEMEFKDELLIVENQQELQPYDYVYIRRSEDFREVRKVQAIGEVQLPGEYVLLSENDRISDILLRAGGFTDVAYLDGVFIERPSILKLDQEVYLERIEELAVALDGQLAGGTLLPQERQSLQDKITLLRERFEEQRKNSLNADEELFYEKIAIDLKSTSESSDIKLENGDRLIIPRRTETVRVSGKVEFPTITQFDPNKNFKSYLNDAGGVQADVGINKAYLVYANGRASRTRRYLGFIRIFPKVQPGSEIIVPEPVINPRRFRLDLNQALQTVTTLTSLIIAVRVLQDTTN